MKTQTAAALGALALAALGITALSLSLASSPEAQAADHTDPPAVAGMRDPGDIADFYAWHQGSGADQMLVTVITFAGLDLPTADQQGRYDEDMLYTVHIDNDGDHLANHTIYARYGKNVDDQWGVQVIGLPGEPGPVVGAVEQRIQGSSGRVWTGLRDDPFFFDFQGFLETAQTGTLSFQSTRDSFAGSNVTALVYEIPMAAALGAGTSLNIWATTAKK